MNKRCTNPSCRKTFSTLYFSGSCPHCGKPYPQISSSGKKSLYWSVRILDFTENNDNYIENKVRVIKLIRSTFNLGLREAHTITKRCPDVLFQLNTEDAEQFIQALEKLNVPYKKKSIPCRNGQSQYLVL